MFILAEPHCEFKSKCQAKGFRLSSPASPPNTARHIVFSAPVCLQGVWLARSGVARGDPDVAASVPISAVQRCCLPSAPVLWRQQDQVRGTHTNTHTHKCTHTMTMSLFDPSQNSTVHLPAVCPLIGRCYCSSTAEEQMSPCVFLWSESLLTSCSTSAPQREIVLGISQEKVF